jgi:hypothetical protein
MSAPTRYALAAGLLLALVQTAQAQTAQAQGPACFEVIPARPNIEPPAAIMVDKCSGRSWVLIRNGKSYRWSLIATEIEKPKIADRAPVEGAAPAPEAGSQKCFTFNNRKFCE